MNKILLPAITTALLLGAAAASAQSLPPYYNQSSDLPWSVNHQPARNLNAYNPDQAQPSRTAARQDVGKPAASLSARTTVARSAS